METPPKYSSSIRLWHWANTLVIAGSLLTVLINSTLLDRKSASALIENELHQAGANVSPEQARSAWHGLEDQVWDYHVYFGYALAALLVFRLVSEWIPRSKNGMRQQVSAAIRAYRQHPDKAMRHRLVVKLLYVTFYVVLVIMVISGLLLVFKSDLGIAKPISHSIKEVHGFCMYLVLGFIGIHVAGVFMAERKDEPGIVSGMINGRSGPAH